MGGRISVQNSLRLEFIDLDLGTFLPNNFAVSTVGIPVAVGPGWTTISFPIAPSDLTLLPGGTSIVDALMSTDVLRIYHSDGATIPGRR